jgi:hypothetical protein
MHETAPDQNNNPLTDEEKARLTKAIEILQRGFSLPGEPEYWDAVEIERKLSRLRIVAPEK